LIFFKINYRKLMEGKFIVAGQGGWEQVSGVGPQRMIRSRGRGLSNPKSTFTGPQRDFSLTPCWGLPLEVGELRILGIQIFDL
jgi:hypothetical protein